MANSSYVVIESNRLHEWCRRVINLINDTRQKACSEIIDQLYDCANKPYRSFCGLGRTVYPDVSREVIEEREEQNRYSTYYRYKYHMYGNSKNVAEDLLLASQTSTHVNVSVEDISCLGGWIEPSSMFQHRLR
jgi:hypothetical protein